MSGHVDPAGWYKTTNSNLESATLATVISEDIHNIEHYYANNGVNAPMPNIIYLSGRINNKSVFVRASNMPHTETIIKHKFTAFAQKAKAPAPSEATSTKAKMHKHGFGAVLPSMYIGGSLEIQFKDNEDWKVITLNVEKQRTECLENGNLSVLPSDACDLGLGVIPLLENASVWEEDILQLFKAKGICTVELHTNPTFKGHNDVTSKKSFSHFLESVQHQFEEALDTNKIGITGVFLEHDTENSMFYLPHNFMKELYHPAAPIYPFPYSPYGTSQLEARRDFDVQYTDTNILCRTMINDLPVFFTITDKGAIVHDKNPSPGFVSQFRVWIGRAPQMVREYTKYITSSTSGVNKKNSVEIYADGLAVNIAGLRLTSRPLRGHTIVARSLAYGNWTRIGVDITDEYTKTEFVDSKEHKELSGLKRCEDGSTKRGNIIEFVCTVLEKLIRSSKDSGPEGDVSDERLLKEIATSATVRLRRAKQAGVEGCSYETRCAEAIRNEFESIASVVEGDVRIRREFLNTDKKEFTGIDILLQIPDSMNIAIQCKRSEKISSEEYVSFLRTFKEACRKHHGTVTHGLFVVDKTKTLTWNEGLHALVSTPGVSIVRTDGFDTEALVKAVKSTVEFYENQVPE